MLEFVHILLAIQLMLRYYYPHKAAKFLYNHLLKSYYINKSALYQLNDDIPTILSGNELHL